MHKIWCMYFDQSSITPPCISLQYSILISKRMQGKIVCVSLVMLLSLIFCLNRCMVRFI